MNCPYIARTSVTAYDFALLDGHHDRRGRRRVRGVGRLHGRARRSGGVGQIGRITGGTRGGRMGQGKPSPYIGVGGITDRAHGHGRPQFKIAVTLSVKLGVVPVMAHLTRIML